MRRPLLAMLRMRNSTGARGIRLSRLLCRSSRNAGSATGVRAVPAPFEVRVIHVPTRRVQPLAIAVGSCGAAGGVGLWYALRREHADVQVGGGSWQSVPTEPDLVTIARHEGAAPADLPATDSVAVHREAEEECAQGNEHETRTLEPVEETLEVEVHEANDGSTQAREASTVDAQTGAQDNPAEVVSFERDFTILAEHPEEADIADAMLANVRGALPSVQDISVRAELQFGRSEPVANGGWTPWAVDERELHDRVADLAALHARREEKLAPTVICREGEGAPALGVDEFVRAAAEMSLVMSDAQLRDYVAELSGALVRSRHLHARRFARALAAAETQRQAEAAARAEAVLARCKIESESALEERRKALESTLRGHAQQLEAECSDWAAREAETCSQLARDQMEELIATHAEQESRRLDARTSALQRLLETVERFLAGRGGPAGVTAASCGLATGLLCLQGTLLGSPPTGWDSASLRGVEDRFAAHVLSALPFETKQRCCRVLLTEEELVREFEEQATQYVAAALSPSSQGLLSDTLGWIFAWIYRFRPVEEAWLDARGDVLRGDIASRFSLNGPMDPADVVQENLSALATAAGLLRCGKLHEAVVGLEATLQGKCRLTTAHWCAEARHMLMVRQAVRTIQARAVCLNVAVGELWRLHASQPNL